MYKNQLFRIILTCVVIGNLAVVGLSQETEEIQVSKVKAETSNKLIITAQTEKTQVKIGESILISINVINNGKKPIFFVKKESPEITNDKGDIFISSPFPFPEDKEEYDYSFHKIEPGGSYSGQILIPGKIINREDELDIRMKRARK